MSSPVNNASPVNLISPPCGAVELLAPPVGGVISKGSIDQYGSCQSAFLTSYNQQMNNNSNLAAIQQHQHNQQQQQHQSQLPVSQDSMDSLIVSDVTSDSYLLLLRLYCASSMVQLQKYKAYTLVKLPTSHLLVYLLHNHKCL